MLKMKVIEIVSQGSNAVLRVRHVNSGQDRQGNPHPEKDRIEEIERVPHKCVDIWREWPNGVAVEWLKLNCLFNDIVKGAGFGVYPIDETLRNSVSWWRKRQDRRKRFEGNSIEEMRAFVGTAVKKITGKPFKNGAKEGIVLDVVEDPWTHRPAFVLEGCGPLGVDARGCMPAEEEIVEEET